MLKDLSKKYTQFAESIMSALPPGEVPADLSDSHLFAKSCEMGQEQFNEDGLREAATTVANGYDSCTSMVAVRRFFASHPGERVLRCESLEVPQRGAAGSRSTLSKVQRAAQNVRRGSDNPAFMPGLRL